MKITSLLIERCWPFAGSALCLAAWVKWSPTFPPDAGDLLATSATVASVIVGFLTAAAALILSISSSRVYRHLKSQGVIDVLFEYLKTAIYAGILFLIVCIAGFFFESNTTLYVDLWVATGAAMMLLFLRITGLLLRLVGHV
ncbi:hypothetical protein [Brevundimonas sp.]|uniref:hypothetical protein n=1 Tax=Brevundimonas sp. TaxID=1871086 RepID=UPI0028994A8C|nr:hypothetical protein [Brevundimonas sp.]